jgi:DNA-binding HxlR family transcriptional regulator
MDVEKVVADHPIARYNQEGIVRRNEMSAAQPNTSARKRFACPVDGFQQVMNGKYKRRILWDLQDGPHRYGEIKKGLLHDRSDSQEIAPRVLSRELKALATLDLIERTEYQVVPPKVEYTLTPLGQSLLPIIAQMVQWGTEHLLRDDVALTNEA